MTACVAFLQHSEWDVPGMLTGMAEARGFVVSTFRADRVRPVFRPPAN